MSQLKFLAAFSMYACIIFTAATNLNIPIAVLSTILCAIYIKQKISLKEFNKIIKNELNSQREFFINSLSHDIRIPTIAQIRALELLKNENFGSINDSQKDMIAQIEDSCKCILNLLSLLINTYDIENEKHRLFYEKFNLSEVITSCFDELISSASEKNITFEYNNKIQDTCIIADKAELKKVITNILSASISNTNSGEKISVDISMLNDKIRLNFTCGNNYSISNFYEHSDFTSIGHCIKMGFCKRIIENHKGKIIKSDNNNLFSFELPIYAYNK